MSRIMHSICDTIESEGIQMMKTNLQSKFLVSEWSLQNHGLCVIVYSRERDAVGVFLRGIPLGQGSLLRKAVGGRSSAIKIPPKR